jgi:hypothetical protein
MVPHSPVVGPGHSGPPHVCLLPVELVTLERLSLASTADEPATNDQPVSRPAKPVRSAVPTTAADIAVARE